MKKIIQTIIICIILLGIVIVPIKGFNVGLPYVANTQININIGKEFNTSDIKSIVKEVFNSYALIQKVDVYEDMVQITIKEASDEQINDLNTKINEKYGINNTIEDVKVFKNENTKLRTIAKPYFIPMFICLALILIYIIIRFFKLETWKILYKSVLALVVPQLILFSLYAITRLPINIYTPIVSIAVFIISAITMICYLQKQELKLKENEDIKDK